MSADDLHEQLRKLDQIATPVRKSADRETMRFEFNGKPHYLHFYKRNLRSKLSGGYAAKEFANLKLLQEKQIPAVRALALLAGFRMGDRIGDLLITYGVEPAIRLDQYLISHHLSGNPPSHRYRILQSLMEVLKQMGQNVYGHTNLKLSSFIVSNNQVMLADAFDLVPGGLLTEHLLHLAHDAKPFITLADRVRIWRGLVPDAVMPSRDKKHSQRIHTQLRSSENIQSIRLDKWHLTFLKSYDRPEPWSVASKMVFTKEDWQNVWKDLWQQINTDQLNVIKRDASGDVLGTQIQIQGKQLDVMIKRPVNKFFYRYFLDLFRSSRAKRTFNKTRLLIANRLHVEFPLAVFESKTLGYTTASMAIFERVPGIMLSEIQLNDMSENDRKNLFFACGRTLRLIEQAGLTHTDAKSTNWIVTPTANGPKPILIDAYGIRPLNYFTQLFGIQRLLKAMRYHPQYTPTDSKNLCLGFSPRASLMMQEEK